MKFPDITLEELVYRVPSKTDADRWEANHPEIFGKRNEGREEETPESMDTPRSISSSVEFTPPSTDESESDEDDSSSGSESSAAEEVERERDELMDAMEESPTVELPTSPLICSPVASENTPEPYETSP